MRQLRLTVSLSLIGSLAIAGCGDSNTDPNQQPPQQMGAAPVISSVVWTQAPGCMAGVRSDVNMVTTVTDADTDPANLTFTGFVTNCTGSITSGDVTVSCPQLANYSGAVTVTDPEGNSDTQTFNFGPCQSGQAP